MVWLIALGVCGLAHAAYAQDPASARTLVMPFENPKRDTRIFWLGEASAVLLTDELNAVGSAAITREERRQAFDHLEVPPVAALTDATVIRIGQLVGAASVIVGSLQLDGEELSVRARSITLDTGRVRVDVTEHGPLPDLYAIFERVAKRVAPSAGPTGSQLLSLQLPPVAAFENYIKGLLAETPDTAITYLNASLALQPSFDRARLALWDVYSDQGEYDEALAAVLPIRADAANGPRARFLAGLSQLELKLYDDAFRSFSALVEAKPSPSVLNNLGIISLRRGSPAQFRLAADYFNKAADVDPEDPDYLFNLGYASWLAHDTQAAIYWLREALRRNPSDGDAHFVLGTALAVGGSATEAFREKELARRLSSSYDQWDRRPATDPIPKGLERVKDQVELPHSSRIGVKLAASGQRDQEELARFYLDTARRLFQREDDRDAVVDLNRALYLSPYLADAHLLLGRIHLRNGRVHEAIDAFKISLWSKETAEAHVALGEAEREAKDLPAARTEGERALALDPSSAAAKRLLASLDSR
jgi:tetratricopeptide (TPR) repeat protein